MSEGSSAGQLWKETKTAKMACSGSLAPRLIDNECVTAKITCNTVHARHEVPAWSQDILCCTYIWAPPKKWQHYFWIKGASFGSAMREEYNVSSAKAAASPKREYWCGCCIIQEGGCVMTVAPARKEYMCLQSLKLLESPSSLLAHNLPSLCSVNSVNSHTIGIMSRTSNTTDVISRRMRSDISAIGMVSTTEPIVTKMKPSDQRQFRISMAMLGKFKIPQLSFRKKKLNYNS